MRYFLLLGAGFSRNWGGWLANEAFEYLLGTTPIAADPGLRTLLWKHYDTGGFEGALAEVQADFKRDPVRHKVRLDGLQFAISQMFADMNRRFTFMSAGRAWELLRLFLDRFDAMFSLNQDVLLELWYLHTVGHHALHRKWSGAALPGIRNGKFDPNVGGVDWSSPYEIADSSDTSYPPDYQPYYKLHGSSNWTRAGKSLLVIGGEKATEIGGVPLLQSYLETFERLLSEDDARLVVIGYGFRDEHINSILSRAADRGMQMFVIDPAGSSLARSTNPTRIHGSVATKTPAEGLFEKALIGTSRRNLLSIFSKEDMIEYDKIERFFRA
jgi:hypothetical protein